MKDIIDIFKNREFIKARIVLTKDFPVHLLDESDLNKKQNRILLHDLIHLDDLPEVVNTIDEIISKKKDRLYVHTRIRLDDQLVWFLICCDYHKDKFGIKSDYLQGTFLNMSMYLDSASDDPVINDFRQKHTEFMSDVSIAAIPLSEILDHEYLVKIQMPFKITTGIYSAIYDDKDKLICTPKPGVTEFNYSKFKYHRKESIRINHITTAYWVLASDDENKITNNTPLLETLVLTVSRIANAYVVLFKELQNSDRANKLLSENIEQQMLINSIYNIILEERNSEKALMGVMKSISEYMHVDRIFIYSDDAENRQFNLIYEYAQLNKHIRGQHIIEYSEYPKTVQQLEYSDLYYPTESDHELKRKGIASFVVVNLNGDGRRSGVALYQSMIKDRIPTPQETKILRSTSQIIATLLLQIEVDRQLSRTTEQLKHLAFHDIVLNIPNRALLQENAEKEFKSQKPGAVLCLKITNIRIFNELFGHGYTDNLLRAVAEHTSRSLEPGMSIYRFSGSVMMILISGDDGTKAKQLAERLLYRLKKPWVHLGNEHFLEIGIGISLFPEHGNTSEDIFRTASLAMYKALEYGTNNYAFYIKELERPAKIDYHFTQKIRQSISDEMNGFYLTYQPVIDLSTGAIVSCEAFINWSSDDEWLPTAQIVRIAENMGYDIYMDSWVIENACLACKKIQNELYPDFNISVNITSRDLRSSAILPILERTLSIAQLEPRHLAIEIQENTIVGQAESVIPIIGKLKALGVSLTIDSFGKELSAANLIKYSYIDLVKTEFSLFSNVFDDFDRIILDTVVGLAKTVKKGICIKRIEDQQQMEIVDKYKINMAQGHLFSKPLKIDELYNFVSEHTSTQQTKAKL